MHYKVSGMSCEGCVRRVEKTIQTVPGVTSVSVSLLTESAEIAGNFSFSDLEKAVREAGYEIREESKNDNIPEWKKGLPTLIISGILLLLLMYLSMGITMFHFPAPSFLRDPFLRGITEALLALIIMFLQRTYFIKGIGGIFRLDFTMDTLVSLGSTVSFLYSLVHLFLNSSDSLFFESAAMIPVIVSVGKTLESYAKGKTVTAISSLRKLQPETATLILDGGEKVIPANELEIGMIVRIVSGESFPCDGKIVSGNTSVDESMLTGESLPKDKKVGDPVYSGTVNQNGIVTVIVEKKPTETLLSGIIETVLHTSLTKAPAQRIADRVSYIFVPLVIGISLLTFFLWLILGREIAYAIEKAVSVLVISCPCALGLATPVAIMVGSGLAAKNGILFKSASAMEESGNVKMVVFDKTGTLTEGKPKVNYVFGTELAKLFSVSYSLEKNSTHPLGKAIVEYVGNQKGRGEFTSAGSDWEIKEIPGNGMEGIQNGKTYYGGNESFLRSLNIDLTPFSEEAKKHVALGETILYFAEENQCIGFFALSDSLKENVPNEIRKLTEMGIESYLLSGDLQIVSEKIAEKAGIKKVIAEVLPGEKAQKIGELKSKLSDKERIAMVGDGINDAPALTASDIGMAIGNGSDIAIQSGNVILLNSSVSDVVKTIRLGQLIRRNIRENLFWAFFYNALMIPLAMGVYTFLPFSLNPMIASLMMSLSSLTVVINALRLNTKKLI